MRKAKWETIQVQVKTGLPIKMKCKKCGHEAMLVFGMGFGLLGGEKMRAWIAQLPKEAKK